VLVLKLGAAHPVPDREVLIFTICKVNRNCERFVNRARWQRGKNLR
jgi:hypothetical protein